MVVIAVWTPFLNQFSTESSSLEPSNDTEATLWGLLKETSTKLFSLPITTIIGLFGDISRKDSVHIIRYVVKIKMNIRFRASDSNRNFA
jgi:hypothetical protein